MTKSPAPQCRSKKDSAFSRAQAETLALQALTFLAQESQRIERFLQLTGLAPADLPKLAPRSDFLLAVLDHLAGDEELLLNFALELQVKPETVASARRALGAVDVG